jgi:hypothetical protein
MRGQFVVSPDSLRHGCIGVTVRPNCSRSIRLPFQGKLSAVCVSNMPGSVKLRNRSSVSCNLYTCNRLLSLGARPCMVGENSFP